MEKAASLYGGIGNVVFVVNERSRNDNFKSLQLSGSNQGPDMSTGCFIVISFIFSGRSGYLAFHLPKNVTVKRRNIIVYRPPIVSTRLCIVS